MIRVEIWPHGWRRHLSGFLAVGLAAGLAVAFAPRFQHEPVQSFCAGIGIGGGRPARTPQAAVAEWIVLAKVEGATDPANLRFSVWRIASDMREQAIDPQLTKTEPQPRPYITRTVTFDERSTDGEVLRLGLDSIHAHQRRDGLWALDGGCVHVRDAIRTPG